MHNINIKHAKLCALCSHWYDPTNSAVQPVSPTINLWAIDDKCERKMCSLKKMKMRPMSSCPRFECKLDIL